MAILSLDRHSICWRSHLCHWFSSTVNTFLPSFSGYRHQATVQPGRHKTHGRWTSWKIPFYKRTISNNVHTAPLDNPSGRNRICPDSVPNSEIKTELKLFKTGEILAKRVNESGTSDVSDYLHKINIKSLDYETSVDLWSNIIAMEICTHLSLVIITY